MFGSSIFCLANLGNLPTPSSKPIAGQVHHGTKKLNSLGVKCYGLELGGPGRENHNKAILTTHSYDISKEINSAM